MSLDVYLKEFRLTTIYDANITHNLNEMAEEAGIYNHLWRPDEIGITHAKQLIIPLREGFSILSGDPKKFMNLNPENKWGDYSGLVVFVRSYLSACEENPESEVHVSR